MRNMLAIWRAHGLDEILREAWEQGTVLAGLSAGRDVLVRGRHHEVVRRARRPSQGLGLLPGSMSVHLDGEPDRRRPYVDAVATGALPAGLRRRRRRRRCCGEDRELTRVVGSKPGLHCIRVEADGVTEVPVEALSSRPSMMRALDADVRELRSLRYRASAGR